MLIPGLPRSTIGYRDHVINGAAKTRAGLRIRGQEYFIVRHSVLR